MLPSAFEEDFYWNNIYHQPPSFWRPALEEISLRHLHGRNGWERAALGRNIVFLDEKYAIKLGPPCWLGDMQPEIAILPWISGKLAVNTPELEAAGQLEGWDYQVQRRMPGRNLRELWHDLDPYWREQLAHQQGEIISALQALVVDELACSPLRFDWARMIDAQRASCAQEMRRSGMREELAGQIDAYLERAAPLLAEDGDTVLLHGDLTHLNLMIQPQGDGWSIAGLIDWGDAKLGPRGHEFISPMMHMIRGDPAALRGFYRGCGWKPNKIEIMARIMLYYASDFIHETREVQNLGQCSHWDCIATRLLDESLPS